MSMTIPSPDNRVRADLDTRLTGLLRGVVARPGIHHATIAIASGDGRHRWSAAAGPAHPGTPFFIASITKRFIVTLVLQAHERGDLDLAAPITAYLPAEVTTGLHVRGGVDRSAAITVRHLASHTSGLPDYFENGMHKDLIAGRDVEWTFEDVLRITRQEQRPHFEPQNLAAARQKARYSDTGFQLLIRIVETVSGRTFADLLTEQILRPLGLHDTWLPGRHPAAAAPLPIHAGRRHVDLPGQIASSNDLFSTTADLLTFNRALIGGELFSDPATPMLLTERNNRLRNIPMLRYGLGTMFFTVGRLMAAGRRKVTLVGHSGTTGTWLFHCPELDVHLAGTVDQTNGQAVPFRIMARCLHLWRS